MQPEPPTPPAVYETDEAMEAEFKKMKFQEAHIIDAMKDDKAPWTIYTIKHGKKEKLKANSDKELPELRRTETIYIEREKPKK